MTTPNPNPSHAHSPSVATSVGLRRSTRQHADPSAPVTRTRLAALQRARRRTRHCSLCTRAQPSRSRSSSTTPCCRSAPRGRSRPAPPRLQRHASDQEHEQRRSLTAERRDQRRRMPKPGTSVSISITAPTTNAMTPPTPSDAEARHERLGDHERQAEQDQRQPGVVDRQHLQRVQRRAGGDRADHARQHDARVR